MSLAVLEGVLHGAGGEDSRDQNLDMVMVYDNSNQVELQKYRSRIMEIFFCQVWRQGPAMRTGRAGHGVAVVSM